MSMNKQYNVDDILNEIKSKKAQQNASVKKALRADPPVPPRPRTKAGNIEDSTFAPPPVRTQPKPEPVPEAQPRQEVPAADPMDNTGVFFSSLTSHREDVRTRQQEEEKRLRAEQLEQEKLLREKLEQEKLELEKLLPESPAQNEPLDDDFFFDQQPADLPKAEGSTPFGDFEPVTPEPNQPDPALEEKTEYQKYFAGLDRKKKRAAKASSAKPAADSLFDASLFAEEKAPAEQPQPEEDFFASTPVGSIDDDPFASTPTGLTEEFATASLFSGSRKKAADSDKQKPSDTSRHFQVNLPNEADEEEPKEQAVSGKKSGKAEKRTSLFHKQEAQPQEPSSRLADADNIPVPEEPSSRLADADSIPVPEEPSSNSEDEELEDYSSPKDKDAILNDIRSIKKGLLLRIVVMVVLFSLSLYLALAARDIQIGDELLPLPTFIQPEVNLRAYMITSCLISAIGAVVCSNTIGGGLLALLRFRATTDTLPMLALLGTLAQGICYIIRPEYFSVDKADFGTNLYLFFPVALFVLIFNLIGKMLVILRIQNNFKLVSSEKRKQAAVFLKDRTLLREISKGLSMEEYTIAYPESTRFLANFLDNSYSEDHAENTSRILAPVCLLAGIVLAALSYLFNKNVAEAVSTFTVIMCISAPLTSTIAANLPLYRMSARLIPAGAMVSGYSAVDAFSRTEAVVLDAKDLFRPADVVLHGIKPFDQGKIDSVILDAASVVCNSGGMLTEVFNGIIGSNRSMLRPVENLTYEDAMGLSAWVDGKRVLIGNRELMVNHGIEVPSNDYEMRFVKDSKNIIYLSNSGQLSAMFVISYGSNAATRAQLDQLASHGMYLIVNTSDPNITPEKIHAAYDFPLELIQLMPAKHHPAYEELTAEKDSSPAKIGFIGSSRMMVTAILDCMTAKTAIDQAVLIQMIALVVGYGLVTLFSLMGNLAYLSILHLILFQLCWAVIGTVIPNLKKY